MSFEFKNKIIPYCFGLFDNQDKKCVYNCIFTKRCLTFQDFLEQNDKSLDDYFDYELGTIKIKNKTFYSFMSRLMDSYGHRKENLYNKKLIGSVKKPKTFWVNIKRLQRLKEEETDRRIKNLLRSFEKTIIMINGYLVNDVNFDILTGRSFGKLSFVYHIDDRTEQRHISLQYEKMPTGKNSRKGRRRTILSFFLKPLTKSFSLRMPVNLNWLKENLPKDLYEHVEPRKIKWNCMQSVIKFANEEKLLKLAPYLAKIIKLDLDKRGR